MTNPADRVWAYLHNEMGDEERELFQHALSNDAELREAVECARRPHHEFKTLLPHLEDEGFDELLEERLLAKWESEHPEYAEIPRKTPPHRILLFAAPLAAAAALALLIGLPLQTGPVHWQRTAYGTAPQLRGQTGTGAYYTRSDLKTLDRALRQSGEAACRQQGEPPEKWTLKISLQELIGGALAVEVSGHPRGEPDFSKVWKKSFQGLEPFQTEVPRFGKQIAEVLRGSAD